jgi:hypothetical protein
MWLREIRKRLKKLWDSLMGTVEKVLEWNQIPSSGSHAAACDWEEYRFSERRLEGPCESNGHDPTSSAFMARKAEIAAGSAKDKTQVSAGDVARGILGPDSGATISNVLVVRPDGAMPLKRTEIHLQDPEQVPAVFKLLSTALQNSGFEFRAARISGMPATEIWLTAPLDNQTKTWLFCGANRGADGFRNSSHRPTLHETRLNKPGSVFSRHTSRRFGKLGLSRVQHEQAKKSEIHE